MAVYGTSVLLSKVYNEAMSLLRQARDYAQHHREMDFMSVNIAQGLFFTSEASRITSRLTQIVSWYLTQIALLHGDINLTEARSDEYKVEAAEDLVNDAGELDQATPETLRFLLQESRTLYLRVARLDGLFRRNTAYV